MLGVVEFVAVPLWASLVARWLTTSIAVLWSDSLKLRWRRVDSSDNQCASAPPSGPGVVRLRIALCSPDALQRPSLEALIPRIVKAEQMPAVAALQAFRGSLAMVGGPALGGVLVVTFGPALAFSVDLFTFIVSLIALTLMQAVPPPPEADRPGIKSIIEGLRYARSRQELLGTYLVDMNAMFFGIPMALFPAIAESYGGASVGFLYAAPAAGSLVMSLMLGWTKRVHRHGLAVGIAAACWGLAIIAFGFAGRLWLALLCLAVAGASDMISGVFRMIIWNQTIPDHLRGRLAGIELISYHTGPMLGNAESGIVASLFSIRTS